MKITTERLVLDELKYTYGYKLQPYKSEHFIIGDTLRDERTFVYTVNQLYHRFCGNIYNNTCHIRGYKTKQINYDAEEARLEMTRERRRNEKEDEQERLREEDEQERLHKAKEDEQERLRKVKEDEQERLHKAKEDEQERLHKAKEDEQERKCIVERGYPTADSQLNCEVCGYITSRPSQYNRHLLSNKHIVRKQNIFKYACSKCNKKYQHQSSLCKHSNICGIADERPAPLDSTTHDMMKMMTDVLNSNVELQKQTRELQQQMLDICEKKTTNVNNRHKSFNINVFLNEKCGNAMNLSDFVKQIQVSREDLENTAQLGFVNGISKIFLDNLKQLDIHERPIHCTDVKRETIYVRSDNKWNKENDDTKLRNAIQEISRKSVGTPIGWKKENPDYADGDSEFSQLCIPMLRNSIAGDDRDAFYPKAVRTILKNITLAKYGERKEPTVSAFRTKPAPWPL